MSRKRSQTRCTYLMACLIQKSSALWTDRWRTIPCVSSSKTMQMTTSKNIRCFRDSRADKHVLTLHIRQKQVTQSSQTPSRSKSEWSSRVLSHRHKTLTESRASRLFHPNVTKAQIKVKMTLTRGISQLGAPVSQLQISICLRNCRRRVSSSLIYPCWSNLTGVLASRWSKRLSTSSLTPNKKRKRRTGILSLLKHQIRRLHLQCKIHYFCLAKNEIRNKKNSWV